MVYIAELKYIRLKDKAVAAILDGYKSQMRFALERQDIIGGKMTEDGFVADVPGEAENGLVIKPPYVVGDTLAVRESWAVNESASGVGDKYIYRADFSGNRLLWTASDFKTSGLGKVKAVRWKQSTSMPNDAVRIFLLVSGMKVERLQDISLDDIGREGIFRPRTFFPKDEFIRLWDSGLTKAKRGIHAWENNPWVYAVLFRRISKEDALKAVGLDSSG